MKSVPKQANNDSNRSTAEAAQGDWEKQSAQAAASNSRTAAAQRALISGINDSPRMLAQRRRIEDYLGTGQPPIYEPAPPASPIPQQQPIQRLEHPDDEEKEALQGKFASEPPAQLERQPSPNPNNTGLPDNLKSGIESLSGMSMDHVKVHYNSSQPAQLNALAYAQGTDIHIAPGQEQHLPHEAWHVVQQAQGRVRPTMQMKDGVKVNDAVGLEKEADLMGEKAVQMRAEMHDARLDSVSYIQEALQMKVGFEFEARGTKIVKTDNVLHQNDQEKANLINTSLFNIESDNGYFEIVTPAFDEPGGNGALDASMDAIERLVLHLERERRQGRSDTTLQTLIGLSDEEDDSIVPGNAELAKNEDEDGNDFIKVTGDWGIRLETDRILSHPQATVGIRLDKIGSLVNMLASGGVAGKANGDNRRHNWDTKQDFGAAAQKNYAAKAVSNVNSNWPALAEKYKLSKEFKGFLVIVSTYLICAHQATTPFEDAKGIAPFMSRVNLSDMANAMSPKDLVFMSYKKAPSLIMRLAGVGVNESPLYKHKFSEEGLYTHDEKTKKLPQLTNRQWLKRLLKDKVDMLADFGESMSEVSVDPEAEGRSLEDFHMGNATDIGGNRKGMVMEIRRLPRNLPVDEWKRVAKKVYEIVALLNASKR